MRKLTVGLFIFMAGWCLSWFTNDYFGNDPLQPTQPVITPPSKSINSEKSATGVSSTAFSHQSNLASLLQSNDFEAVVERYESLQFQLDDMAAAKARTKILSYARQLLEQSRFSLAEELLQRLLIAAYRDVEAHMLLAEMYLGEQDFNAAIDQLYEVKGYAYRPVMLQRITSRIRSTVAELVSSLKGNNDQNALLVLYQHLSQREPDHAPWFIGLAAAQLALDDKEAARRSLLLVSQDPDVGAQAQVMLSKLTIELAGMPDTNPLVTEAEVVGIPLHLSGNHFIVDASPGL